MLRRRPKIDFDLLRFHPELSKASKRASKGKTDSVARWAAESRRPPWKERGKLESLLARGLPLAPLDDWCRLDPTCPDPWLLRGVRRTHWAWEARGGGRAHSVGEDSARLFFQRLDGAQSDLLWASELLPEDPVPLAALIRVAMGLSAGGERIVELFEAATARDPELRLAYRSAHYALAEKWGGSHEEMFAIARRAAELATPDNALADVLADAHVERWLYFSFVDDDDGARAYLRQPDPQEEVATLFDRVMCHPRFLADADNRVTFNGPALWFFLVEDRPRLGRALEALGGAFTEVPWAYLDDPATVIGQARRMAKG